MRTSKISRDTAKLFERVSSPPRRTTRSLAAKFGYATDSADGAIKDMEDAVKPAPRKRKGSPLGGRTRTRRAVRLKTEAEVDVEVEAPLGWEAVYDAVRRMRAPGGMAHGAAVDTMGCERLADRSASPRDQRFHALIALMLSSQTKDTVNAVVMKKLQTELPAHAPGATPGLNLENVLAVEADLLNEMIWAVGFHNNKTRYIKQTAEILRDKWAGDIPDSIEGLTSLPGVGPKMAHLCLSVAWDRTEGIGVDVHVHRITNLWGWHRTKTPEETRRALESWLPRDRWREINGLLVGLGQAVCLPVGRRCGDCELAEGGLCRAAEDKGRKGRPKKEAVVCSVKTETAVEAVEFKTEVDVKAEICDAPPALHQIPLSVSTDPPDSKGPVVGVVPAAT